MGVKTPTETFASRSCVIILAQCPVAHREAFTFKYGDGSFSLYTHRNHRPEVRKLLLFYFFFFSTWSWKIIPCLLFYFFSTWGWKIIPYFDGLAQDCSKSSELAIELLQPCTKPSIYFSGFFSYLIFGFSLPEVGKLFHINFTFNIVSLFARTNQPTADQLSKRGSRQPCSQSISKDKSDNFFSLHPPTN